MELADIGCLNYQTPVRRQGFGVSLGACVQFDSHQCVPRMFTVIEKMEASAASRLALAPGRLPAQGLPG